MKGRVKAIEVVHSLRDPDCSVILIYCATTADAAINSETAQARTRAFAEGIAHVLQGLFTAAGDAQEEAEAAVDAARAILAQRD